MSIVCIDLPLETAGCIMSGLATVSCAESILCIDETWGDDQEYLYHEVYRVGDACYEWYIDDSETSFQCLDYAEISCFLQSQVNLWAHRVQSATTKMESQERDEWDYSLEEWLCKSEKIIKQYENAIEILDS